MSSFTHAEMRAFERYVLTDRKLDEALKMLVEGSDAYNYLRLLHQMVEKGQLSADEKIQLDDFLKRTNYPPGKELDLRSRFLTYDAAHTPEEKSAVLDGILKEYYGATFADTRPQDLTVTGPAAEQALETDNKPFDEVHLAEEFQKLYRKERSIHDFVPDVLATVDLSQFTGPEADQLLGALGDSIALCEPKEVAKFLAGVMKEKAVLQGYSTCDRSLLNRLTLQQIEKLREFRPELSEDVHFVGALFQKKFHTELALNSRLPLKERRANLIKMYEFACSMPAKASGLKSHLLIELLDNGIRQELYEEKYFNEYIRSPLRMTYCKQNAETTGEEWAEYVREVQAKEYGSSHAAANKRDKEIFAAYLDKMFLTGRTVSSYTDYFNKEFLVSVWEESQMMAGKKVEVNSGNAKRLETIKDKVLIDICLHNKESFAFGEEVELFVDLKNVPSLIIKVFDINAENYYLANLSAFRTDVNLDGFVATVERTARFTEAQNIRHRETLKFPEIKNRHGLFVVEMIGNGKSSRAVIKIGSLAYVSKPTVAGQVCYILDSEGKICVGEKTGIRIQDQFFPADNNEGGKLGRIVIPYAPNSGEVKAILLHEGTAQLVDFERMSEAYSFECGFFLHPESVIMGNKAALLLRPRLTINGRSADLSLLENARVTVHAKNFIDDIPVTKVYDNLKLMADRDLELSFNIIAHMKSLSVEFNAEVKCVSTNEKREYHASHQFNMLTHENGNIIEELHFRALNPGPIYEVLLLGKNGEPVANTIVNVQFTTFAYLPGYFQTFLTNSAGTVRLGKLAGIAQVKATVNRAEGQIAREWSVPSQSYFKCAQHIDLIEAEPIELPFVEYLAKPRLFSVANSGSSTPVIADCTTGHIKIIKKEPGAAYSLVRVEGLTEGTYKMTGVDPCYGCSFITVHRGKIWDGKSDFILTPDCLLEIPMRNEYIRIKSVKIAEKDANSATVSVQLEATSPAECRVHVMLYNFLSESMEQLTSSLLGPEEPSTDEFEIRKWKNFYLSNRLLSSELRYCIERRQQGKLTGSTVEKPALVLKGTLIGNTRAEAEKVTSGTAFEAMEEESSKVNKRKRGVGKGGKGKTDEKRKQCECEEEEYSGGGGGEGMREVGNHVVEYQNFLVPPSVFWNAKADGNGAVNITVGKALLAQASGAYVVAIGPAGVAHFVQPLAAEKTAKKDLALQKPFEQDKNYSEARLAVGVEKNESHMIEDITSTHFSIVDSLDMVYGILESLNEMEGGPDQTEIAAFGFVTYWNTLKEEEKLKLYAQYMSHELNLFIMKKDAGFFKKVVKPYLANKMEKDLIDMYLLELPLEEFYDQPHKFDELSFLEKALLVHYLAKSGNLPKAKQCALLMRSEVPEESEKRSEASDKAFDVALMQSALKNRRSELEKMAEEEALRRKEPGYQMMYQDACAEEAEGEEEEEDEECEQQESRPRRRHHRHHAHRRAHAEGEAYFDDDEDLQQRQKPAYTESCETKEYKETHYYRRAYGGMASISQNMFLADFATHTVENPTKPFLSANFTSCSIGLSSILSAAALLEVPFQGGEHGYKSVGERSHEIKAASNFVIFKKAVRQSPAKIQTSLLLGQRYLEANRAGGEDFEVQEFLPRKVYRGQAVITNISSKSMEFNVLVQVPQGSLPVGTSAYQKTLPVSLNSFTTTKVEYLFYFPAPGKFVHASPMVSLDSVVIARGKPTAIQVMAKKSKVNAEDFRDVVANGSTEQIIEFLRDHPIETIKDFSWNYIFWMLKDPKFWGQLIKLLRAQGRFIPRVWEYSLFHKKDVQSIKEYLKSDTVLKRQLGQWFKSGLVEVTPAELGMRHMHYFPLVNPRVHRVASAVPGGDASILNVNMREVYYALLRTVIQKKTLDAVDKLSLCYYLVLQDRIGEANKVFATLQTKQLPKSGSLRLQYDYVAAYFDFFFGQPKFETARRIVEEYKDYPILAWKLKFLDMEQQLQEYDGIELEEQKSATVSKKKLIEDQLSLNAAMKGKDLVVTYTHLSEVELKFYIIDLEVLFSRSPFLTDQTEDFSFVQPTHSMKVALDPKSEEKKVPLPEAYANKNLIIEVHSNATGLKQIVTFFSSSLKVHVYEHYGELQVTDAAGKLLPEVYVKVFAECSNAKFYKDGYTDIRGRFDYATLNRSLLEGVRRFAVLVMSDTHGSLIRECGKPELRGLDQGERVEAEGRLVAYNKAMKSGKGGWKKKSLKE